MSLHTKKSYASLSLCFPDGARMPQTLSRLDNQQNNDTFLTPYPLCRCCLLCCACSGLWNPAYGAEKKVNPSVFAWDQRHWKRRKKHSVGETAALTLLIFVREEKWRSSCFFSVYPLVSAPWQNHSCFTDHRSEPVSASILALYMPRNPLTNHAHHMNVLTASSDVLIQLPWWPLIALASMSLSYGSATTGCLPNKLL